MVLGGLQKQVRDFDEKKGWIDKPYQTVLHLQEELGELSSQLLVEEGYKKGESGREKIAEELSDILYLILKTANHFNINLDEEWAEMIGRYEGK
jgi:NTP pyrophosphatase (non-canonical NTP hydrolase)